MKQGKIVLTFDVEEFDIPTEYGQTVDFETQIEVTTTGLHQVLELISSHKVKCTFFTTAVYAQKKPELIKMIAEKHEIASHGFAHSSFATPDLVSSKKVLEEMTGKRVFGFRMARLAPVDDNDIRGAGYSYNSSLNPTLIPGRYNHLDKSRVPFFNGSLLNIPVSVTPIFRIPLFWLSVKNFPIWFLKILLLRTLNYDGFLSLYFHPWEFTDINDFGLPGFIRRNSGGEMLEVLDHIIRLLKTRADFITMSEFEKLTRQQEK